MKRLILLAATAAGLASCAPPKPYWHSQCLASHTEIMLLPQFIPNGTGGGTTILTPMPYDVCDEYAPAVCIVPPGSETTECPA